MTCHYVKDGICQGSIPVEGMATIHASRYGWDTCTVSFVEDAPHAWRVLWSATRGGTQIIWHSLNIYRTRREAVDAWNGTLVVEALS